MNIETARASIGRMVMSRDAGTKMIRETKPHGPYRLLSVTKAGLVILEGREEFRIAPSLIEIDDKAIKAK